MASDLFIFDNFFSDPFSPFTDTAIDSSHDIYQTLQESLNSSSSSGNNNNNNIIQEHSVDEVTNSLDHIASELLSSSPPSHELENLSLYHITTNQNFSNASDFSAMEVKTEEYQVPFDTITGFSNSFVPQACGSTTHNAVKLMQRSYSSNSFEGKPNFLFQPHLDSVLETPNLQSQVLSSPENNFSSGQMRRVCSTGDLQKMKTNPSRSVLSSSPLSTETSFMEEPNFKVGRYSAEERKERIHRYRAKRNQRNFNKTIKYACRKTLADSRPRIRGRFARNDEAAEIPKAATMFNRYEDEDDLWIDGYHEEDEERSMVRAQFYNSFGSTTPQYQYYSN